MNPLRRMAVLCLFLLTGCLPVLGDATPPSPVAPPSPAPVASPNPLPSATPAASPTPVSPVYAVIAKARGAYWSDAERGALAAERELGLPRGSVAFFAPEKADAASQILALEDFARRGVRGIAIAPNDPRALELSIERARAAGVWVTTFDSDAPQSERLFFVGTPPQTVGAQAAEALLAVLAGRGGKVAIGSTLLNADSAARLAAFKARLKPHDAIAVLDAVEDRQNAAAALAAAKGALAAQKDLAGAFGVYAYNGAAWCRAVQEAKAAERVALVAFDATAETVACLKDGALDALIAPRPFAQGWQSVRLLDALATRGVLAAAAEFGVPTGHPTAEWVVDMGVDVVSRDGAVGQSLAEYAAKLAEMGIAPAWQP